MDINTLKKLASNPHYVLSPKQRAALDEYERKSIQTFGVVPMNTNDFDRHEVKVKRYKR